MSFGTQAGAQLGGNRFVSHSWRPLVALMFNPFYLFRVDTALVRGRAIDLSDGGVLAGVTARNFATNAEEVVVEGFVPQSAAVLVDVLQELKNSWASRYLAVIIVAHRTGLEKTLKPNVSAHPQACVHTRFIV